MFKARIGWVSLLIGLTGLANVAFSLPPTATITLWQRTSERLSGSVDIDVSIGDITAGQTMTQLRRRDGRTLAGPRSLHTGERLEFELDGGRWSLTLVRLHNELIGNDWAQFELSQMGPSLQQTQHVPEFADPKAEIDALIALVESTQGAVFIRNGKEYDAKTAADHLRRKFKTAGPKIRNAEDFIERIASKSSLSGNPYAMRLSTGETVDAGEWFDAQLARLRSTPNRGV